jgi:hypothetical protein
MRSRPGLMRAFVAAACSWSTITCSCGCRRRIEFYDVPTADDLPAEVRPHAEAAQGGAGFFAILPCASRAEGRPLAMHRPDPA